MLLAAVLLLTFYGCQENKPLPNKAFDVKNSVSHASGLSIFKYDGYSIVKISDPWPDAATDYTYILKQKNAVIPDSLKNVEYITVPIRNIIVTSTTHIPSLEMLGVANTLTGFPNLNYISSEKVRSRIDAGKIRELGNNQSLNTEVIIDLQPDVIIGYGIDNNNPMLDNLKKSGLKIVINGDWNEQTPLGKAEWIKLYGALYGLEEKADQLFSAIEKEYQTTLALAKKAVGRPTAMAGAIFESKWYLPQGNSWGALFIKDAGGNYLWADSKGTGSLSLPFESVLEKARDADVWIGPGQFASLKQMTDDNPHYNQFKSFKLGNVYSFSTKKGKTGGVIYYELAPNRPDLVIKDVLKILHPELLPNYKPYFFEKLN